MLFLDSVSSLEMVSLAHKRRYITHAQHYVVTHTHTHTGYVTLSTGRLGKHKQVTERTGPAFENYSAQKHYRNIRSSQ